ncbi:hypothetical protein DUI87_05072 [Hirundo rustica rustica]|uniref:ribonuclease H n=1 Tax=Hirundo rustica rustica TaxID=333673 RepID=A0A3M0KZQ4_HIRRU|nr:hypothetical protein DUI87_05072 [Hirundo rustica rustica]
MESFASRNAEFPMFCQWYVAHALSGVRKRFPDAHVYHYMDDILVATPTQEELLRLQPQLLNALHSHGLQVAPEKQTPWKTIEQGIQRLREMAVAEMVFSDDINTKNPDLVSCTSVMWRKLIRLGPLEYATALAVMKWEDMEETVLDMAKKLRAYADAVHSPTHARIAAVETRLQKLEDKIDENHKKLKEEIREDLLQISAVQIRAAEVFKKGKKIIQILLKASFAIKKSKVKGPAHEIQFLRVKWQDRRRQIPTEVINKITAMSPPTNKKETQAFLGAIGFWRMYVPEYSQIVSPLYLVTCKKNDFHWGPEQQQAFAQIKQETAHAVALGPVRTRPDVKNVLYSAAENNSLS